MGFYDDLRNAYNTYNRLNASERDTLKDILWANPGHFSVLKAAKAEAERWSRNLALVGLDAVPEAEQERRFRASLRDGPADAARHCYWSALLASKLAYNDASAWCSPTNSTTSTRARRIASSRRGWTSRTTASASRSARA
ncbi:MAG: hypothetical protein IRZ13_20990 [Acetobacteraceae bacterium]|nr:hypothetical protein [Acetobacteraceae bacterium]